MDANGADTDTPSSATVQRVSDYIDLGYGVLLGHDAVGYSSGNSVGYGWIADKFGIMLGTDECIVPTEYCSNGTIPGYWMYNSYYFYATMRGQPTDFPYKVESGDLPISLSHTISNAAFGDVWMQLSNNTGYFYEGNFTLGDEYGWELDGYNETRYGNPYFYLTTYRNTGMIQIGHYMGESTIYERKVLANTIYYLYQRTPLQYMYDNSMIDTPKLDNPNITRIEGSRSIELSTRNETEEIRYKVEGKTSDGNTTCQSDETRFNLTLFAEEYYYIIDTSDSTTITLDMEGQINKTKGVISDIINEDVYIHVASVDNFGKISETSHYFMEITPIYTFTQSNTFTESNTFSESSTFTRSFPFSVSLTHSFVLTYSCTVTETISAISISLISFSFSVSMIDSSLTYVETAIVYYAYTAVAYLFHFTLYSDFFTIIYNNENPSNNGNANIVVIGVCVAVAAILVVALLAVLLIRIRQRRRSSVCAPAEEEMTQGALPNNFSAGLSVANAEEDPFAEDFNEDKHFVSM